ncbi:type II toxin-antitoxin system HicA family toxin [bacterium]|nr:type II toxin-antitoxin system HicA family toxin [bacterium]
MSPKLKRLSGDEVIKILAGFGFDAYKQRGRHVKLRRIVSGSKQSLTVPMHKEIDYGTLRAIIRRASKFIPFNELREVFWSA